MIGCLTESNNEKLTTTTTIKKSANTDHPINELIAKRWSARKMDVTVPTRNSIVSAARRSNGIGRVTANAVFSS